MKRLSAYVLAVCLISPASAQDAQTLADIRAELTQLNGLVQSLKGELSPVSTQNGAQSAARVSGDVLQRVDGIEAELARLTSKTEALENRISRVVTDGTNRVGDLEFRLVELEGGDLGALGATPPLGGQAGSVAAAPATPPSEPGVELAVSEQQDFERAKAALAEGDFRSAAEQFAAFNQAYPGGPLSADAHYLRGEALEGAGDWNNAARAYLESFSGNPQSPRAPEALYKLGLALEALQQTSEACLMLQEVGARYPGSAQVAKAQTALQSLNCG